MHPPNLPDWAVAVWHGKHLLSHARCGSASPQEGEAVCNCSNIAIRDLLLATAGRVNPAVACAEHRSAGQGGPGEPQPDGAGADEDGPGFREAGTLRRL